MHKTWGLLFLAAIFTISGAQYFDSPSKVEGAESEALRGSMIAYRQGLVKQVYSTTNNAISIKLQDLPVGKVVQIGELKYVKVSGDQYISVSSCADPELSVIGASKNFDYTGGGQTYVARAGCEYKLEVWGAQGGDGFAYYWLNPPVDLSTQTSNLYGTNGEGGKGGYVSGQTSFVIDATLYIYIGGQGETWTRLDNLPVKDSEYPISTSGGYNGGGSSTVMSTGTRKWDHGYGYVPSGGGGGASHIALVRGILKDLSSQTSQLLLVAGGGGGGACNSYGGYSPSIWHTTGAGGTGGPTGADGATSSEATGGKGGSSSYSAGLGQGQSTTDDNSKNSSGGGGGAGYYSGGGGAYGHGIFAGAGGGGSNYINTAIFTTATSNQSGVRSGNGYARITRLN